MGTITDIRIGDRVRWASAAGTLRGEIVDFVLDQNANGELVPWLIVENYVFNEVRRIRICGTDAYLKMVKFQVLFRDRSLTH